MSLFTGSHPGLVQPPNIFKSEIKKQLGFSIDSIVGKSEPDTDRPGSSSPVSPAPRSWSPGSSPPAADIKPSVQSVRRDRSRSPLRQRSVSPPTRQSPVSPASPPSLFRPTPSSLPSSPALAQSYLQDQLASLKAFYEAKGQSSPSQAPGLPSPLLPPGLASLPSALPGFPRPPASSLPPFLGLPPHLPGSHLGPQPGPGVPREFPLHPWFINRHRFPLGKLTKLTSNSRG